MNKPTPPEPYYTHYTTIPIPDYSSWEVIVATKEKIMKEMEGHFNPRVVILSGAYSPYMRGISYSPRPSYPDELKIYHTELHKYLAYLKEQERETHEALSQSS
jgi:hypothetical protein